MSDMDNARILIAGAGEVFYLWVPGPHATQADPSGQKGAHAFKLQVANGKLNILEEKHL